MKHTLALLMLVLGLASIARAQPTTAPSPALPIVHLTASEPFSKETPVPCTFKLQPANTDLAPADPLKGALRLRGSSSLGYPKKSFAIALDAPASFLGLRKHQHWILNAAYIDRSLMRHKLAYDLFRSLSTQEHPRFAAASTFVEVHLNGQYNGLYLLMEPIDHDLLNLEPSTPTDLSDAVLYKAINHDAGFLKATHSGFEPIYPNPANGALWQPLDAFLQFVVSAPPAQFKSAIDSHLDLDNAIDFHLLVNVTANADGITKNFYLARPRPRADAPTRFFFVPWDFDGAFGQNWNAEPLPHRIWLSNPLFDRLLQDPAYRHRFAARWKHLKDNQFSIATIHNLINTNARQISAAMKHNITRWPTNKPPYPNRLTFDQDIAGMKDWVSNRIPWLDAHIQQVTR